MKEECTLHTPSKIWVIPEPDLEAMKGHKFLRTLPHLKAYNASFDERSRFKQVP